MKPQSAKNKGRQYQKVVAQRLRETLGVEEEDIGWRSMGAAGEDIILSPKARKLFPYSVEVKAREKLNAYEALEQAQANAKGYTPIVFAKRNRKEPIVIIKQEDFLNLYQRFLALNDCFKEYKEE
jgi:hypothetical protein